MYPNSGFFSKTLVHSVNLKLTHPSQKLRRVNCMSNTFAIATRQSHAGVVEFRLKKRYFLVLLQFLFTKLQSVYSLTFFQPSGFALISSIFDNVISRRASSLRTEFMPYCLQNKLQGFLLNVNLLHCDFLQRATPLPCTMLGV